MEAALKEMLVRNTNREAGDATHVRGHALGLQRLPGEWKEGEGKGVVRMCVSGLPRVGPTNCVERCGLPSGPTKKNTGADWHCSCREKQGDEKTKKLIHRGPPPPPIPFPHTNLLEHLLAAVVVDRGEEDIGVWVLLVKLRHKELQLLVRRPALQGC